MDASEIVAKNPINGIAAAITSSAAVTLGLLVIIIAMVFETQTLLYNQLQQAGMEGVKIHLTSYGLAIGIEFIILLFTANANHVAPIMIGNDGDYFKVSIPQVYGLASFIINFYFWKAYDFSQPWQWIVFRFFISLLLAYINYSLSELFVSKWSAHLNQVDLKVKLDHVTMTNTEFEKSLNDYRVNNTQLIEDNLINVKKIKELKSELNFLRAESDEMRKKLTRKPRKAKG
jgi:hypothetical protein